MSQTAANVVPPKFVEKCDYKPFRFKNRFVRFMGGLPLGLTTLTAIAVASTVGEFLPHEGDVSINLVFHTWWYQGLLILQGFNLTLNTIMTYMEDTEAQFQPLFRKGADNFKPLRIHHKAKFEKIALPDAKAAMGSLAGAFARRGYTAFFDGDSFYAHRGLIARFGSTVTHIGLLTIIGGALVEANFKTEGQLALFEGDKRGEIAKVDDQGMLAGTIPLGFDVVCHDFEFTQYPGTGVAAMFKSTVTFIPPDGEPVHDYVRVNHDVTYGGWTFHQSSYEPLPDDKWFKRYYAVVREDLGKGQHRDYRFEAYGDGGHREVVPLPGRDDRFFALDTVPGGNLIWTVASKDEVVARGMRPEHDMRIEMVRFFPDYAVDEAGVPVNRGDVPNSPAAFIEIVSDDEVQMRQWAFRKESPHYSPSDAEGRPKELDFVVTDVKMDREVGSAPSPAVMGAVDGSAPAADARPLADRAVVTVSVLHQGSPTGRKFDLRVGESVSMMGDSIDPAVAIPGPYDLVALHPIDTYRTILSVSRNPGIPIVWLGSIFASLGPMLAFFVSRRRVWGFVDWNKKTLWLGGESRYSREALETEISEAVTAWSASSEVAAHPPISPPKPAEIPRLSPNI